MRPIWGVLLVAGCMGDGRPLDDYLRDEANRAPAETQPDAGAVGDGGVGGDATVADAAPPPQCSLAGEAVQVTFRNETERTVDVLWVDRACAERPYRTLDPGGEYVQPTFSEHVWRVRDAVTWEVLLDFPGSATTGSTEVVIR